METISKLLMVQLIVSDSVHIYTVTTIVIEPIIANSTLKLDKCVMSFESTEL